MDVRLSPEQLALRDAAADLLVDLGPATVAGLDDDPRRARLDAAVNRAGWRDLRAAAAGAPPPASTVEVAIVAEELGSAVTDTPFLGPTLAAELRRLAGLPVGTTRETVLLRADLCDPVVIGGDGVAVDAAGATRPLGLTATADGYEVVAVPLAPARSGRDLTRPVATMVNGEVERLGGRLDPAELTAWQAFVLALTCADLVGTMRGAVALACGYAKIRHQYGVPIGSFQSVQHLLADAVVATEGATSTARHAAWAVDHRPAPQALAAAASAKAYCARAARTVGEIAIQVHGGIGNTWDCLAHVYLRRALHSTQILGDDGVNLARVMAYRGIGGVHSGLR
jgi:alkylation response protein AidB-like acyl-CoA dehydrogenase